ncbi:TIGR00269 family protein [Candidatus Woesearchaeota archaeon]|nr:TIGR00269 family protein [Candidatus Woesearchaeota archaeon]
MKCRKCSAKAVSDDPQYCKEHFVSHIEKKVIKTIKDYNLLEKQDRICVAVSGGKDSLTTLHILKKLGYDAEGICIDEGIRGYREHTIEDLKHFAEKESIKIRIYSVKRIFGKSLDQLVKMTKRGPCTICGVLRRYLLNKYSQGYDKTATGHNMDDEAQAVMMNLIRNQPEINARLGPKTGLRKFKGFTPRVKPLYFCKEKEIMTYALLNGFRIRFNECPYAKLSFRARIRDMINEQENKMPGSKENIIKYYLARQEKLKSRFTGAGEPNTCSCGQPSKSMICSTCALLQELKMK